MEFLWLCVKISKILGQRFCDNTMNRQKFLKSDFQSQFSTPRIMGIFSGNFNFWNIFSFNQFQFSNLKVYFSSKIMPYFWQLVIYSIWNQLRLESKLWHFVKIKYSEKATKICEIFTLLLSYVVPVKSKVKILWPSQNIWTLFTFEVTMCQFPEAVTAMSKCVVLDNHWHKRWTFM